jgi:hypothetical protein
MKIKFFLLFVFFSLFTILCISKPIEFSEKIDESTLDKFQSIESELINLFGNEYQYYLTSEGTRSFSSLDINGNYSINLVDEDESIFRHELFHIYFFNYLKEKKIELDSLPTWFHELTAVWFQKLHNLEENYSDLRDYYYDFFKYKNNYPPLIEDGLFYKSLYNFSFFLSKKISLKDFLTITTDSFARDNSIYTAFYTAFNDRFIIFKWNIYRFTRSIFFWIFVIIIVVLIFWRILISANFKSGKK